MSRASYRLSVLLLLVAAVAWSTGGFFTRLIGLDTWTMLVWRGLFGAIGMLPFLAWREGGAVVQSVWRVGWPGLCLALAAALSMMLFIASLAFTTVAHVYVVYATVPFLAAGLAWLALREAPSRSAVFAGLGALGGVAIMERVGAEGG